MRDGEETTDEGHRVRAHRRPVGAGLVDRPVPEPGAGEVLVRMAVSGVNPTDWKSRRQLPAGRLADSRAGRRGGGRGGRRGGRPGPDRRAGVDLGGRLAAAVGHRRRSTRWCRSGRRYASATPRSTSGAALGIPFLTAHRCLTAGEFMPDTLRAGALADHTVLVQGGAGAVGNAAIQLARWADATVIATVSSAEKAQLAAAAGASFVINYREQDVVEEVRKIAPDGVAHDRRGLRRPQRRGRRAGAAARRRGLRVRRRRRRRGDASRSGR